ncbi:hypothetical protein EDD76_101173 [Kineothrix alysoides]|uniref:Uncharacterized protein n=1 Tax=Kineothrix alysoides TaxID=1469948 RepID=A0A4R1R688_9FIRM|nr:hypothetical protein [Kineothrix alysoides]TCL61076.1 hypothetical protein EDD76_101173 [Kineothrix alysoides]
MRKSIGVRILGLVAILLLTGLASSITGTFLVRNMNEIVPSIELITDKTKESKIVGKELQSEVSVFENI